MGRILLAVHNGPEVIPVCLAHHRKSGRATLWAPGKCVVVCLGFRKPRLSLQASRYLPLSDVCGRSPH